MGIQLPGALVSYLNQLGIMWPEGDEEKVYEYGKAWMDMGKRVEDIAEEGHRSKERLCQCSEGDAAEAFRRSFEENDGPTTNGKDLALGLKLGGGVLYVAAAAILAFKIYAIVQLVQLMANTLKAIAMAPPTYGASLKMIPIYQQIAKYAIEAAINQVIKELEA